MGFGARSPRKVAADSHWRHSSSFRDRPKFGFGFGYVVETDLTYGFGLVSATAKVHWHKFGFGRNITPKRRNRRNCKICVNFNTGSLVLVGIDDPKLDSTTSHPSSSSHSLPRRVVCHPGHPAPTIMGGLVLYGFSAHASFTSTVRRQFVSVSATVTAVSEPSVSAVVSVTAITGLQLRRHFRLRPKPEKLVAVGIYRPWCRFTAEWSGERILRIFILLFLPQT